MRVIDEVMGTPGKFMWPSQLFHSQFPVWNILSKNFPETEWHERIEVSCGKILRQTQLPHTEEPLFIVHHGRIIGLHDNYQALLMRGIIIAGGRPCMRPCFDTIILYPLFLFQGGSCHIISLTRQVQKVLSSGCWRVKKVANWEEKLWRGLDKCAWLPSWQQPWL